MNKLTPETKPDPHGSGERPDRTPLPAPDDVPHDAIDAWEDEMYLSMGRRLRLAYIVAAIGVVIGILGIGAVYRLTPLKELVPLPITVDKHTGLANVGSRLGTVTMDDDEYVTQALLYQYVRDRETYDVQDQKERIDAVYTISRDAAASDLAALYAETNPNSPMNIYGGHGRVKTRIRSVTLEGNNRARLRITKQARSQPGAPFSERNFMVLLSYGFDRTGNMTLEERWENPTGFFVTNYRLDEEAS